MYTEEKYPQSIKCEMTVCDAPFTYQYGEILELRYIRDMTLVNKAGKRIPLMIFKNEWSAEPFEVTLEREIALQLPEDMDFDHAVWEDYIEYNDPIVVETSGNPMEICSKGKRAKVTGEIKLWQPETIVRKDTVVITLESGRYEYDDGVYSLEYFRNGHGAKHSVVKFMGVAVIEVWRQFECFANACGMDISAHAWMLSAKFNYDEAVLKPAIISTDLVKI